MNDSIQLYGGELSVVTRPIPKVTTPTDVLLKIAYSGVCGTDLHILAGEFPCSEKAVTLGHEFSGVVVAVGDGVTHVTVGDQAVVNPNSNCHICAFCASGQPHFCKTGGINSTTGIWKNGGWAKYCKVSSVLVHKLPQTIPLSTAVFTEPYSCIARGWEMLGEIKADASVLVCGAGIIGLLWASLLHFKGFRGFVISELAESRRKLATDMNLGLRVVEPEHLLNQEREARRTHYDDWGFDVVIDCTGAPTAITQAFQWLRRGGKFLLFGCCPKSSQISISPFDIYYKELTIIGSHINPFTFPKALSLVSQMQAYLDYSVLGVKTFQLQDYAEALEALKKGEISKAVFHVDRDSDN